MSKKKVLFLLKRREDYNSITHNHLGLSTGLYNSAKFMNDMLQSIGVESNLEVVIDNNCIDREVTKYRPTHVIIEAMWVVPSKFSVLQKLHPNVTWIVRLHSEMPFMSGEGIAMDWIGEYSKFRNVIIGVNAPRMRREVCLFLKTLNNWNQRTTTRKVIYLPNFYPQDYKLKQFDRKKDTIDISCFGAIRPLKNHLLQAHAAVDFAESIGKRLRFHINGGRTEMKGEPILHNLRGMFEHLTDRTGHELVSHDWTPRDGFVELCSQMDIGMQCNFSETFNIVGADLISQGVPLVGSKEIPWSSKYFNSDPTDSRQMCEMLERSYSYPKLNVKLHQRNLRKYTEQTKKVWAKYFL